MKNKNIHIRVDEETHETIKRKALESYLTISEYVVQCSLGKQIFVIPGLDEMVLEQKRIGIISTSWLIWPTQTRFLLPDWTK